MHPVVARFAPRFLSTSTNKTISFNYIFKIRRHRANSGGCGSDQLFRVAAAEPWLPKRFRIDAP